MLKMQTVRNVPFSTDISFAVSTTGTSTIKMWFPPWPSASFRSFSDVSSIRIRFFVATRFHGLLFQVRDNIWTPHPAFLGHSPSKCSVTDKDTKNERYLSLLPLHF